MKPPAEYSGVLLLDGQEPPHKSTLKLTTEQKSLHKAALRLLDDDPDTNKGWRTPKVLRPNTQDPPEIRVMGLGLADHDWWRQPISDPAHLCTCLISIFGLEDSNHRVVNRLYRLLRVWQAAYNGGLVLARASRRLWYSPMGSGAISLVGMDNWKNVMCYMDSVLVCMFCNNAQFDFLLDESVDDKLTPELQAQVVELKQVLRFIVSLLRTGEFVPAALMQQLCIVLDNLGCDMALSGSQQDALQLYEFLAESLSMPLLTMKLDIIHSGRLNLSDDLRLIQERTVLLSVPEPGPNEEPDAHISLEECMNNYFNNSVTVRRHLDRRRVVHAATVPAPAMPPSEEVLKFEQLGVVRHSREGSSTVHHSRKSSLIESLTAESRSRNGSFNTTTDGSVPTPIPMTNSSSSVVAVPSSPVSAQTLDLTPIVTSGTDGASTAAASNSTLSIAPSQVGSISKVSDRIEASRTRSSTIFSVLNTVTSSVSDRSRFTRRASSISNAEVSLPAWMFLQLLPYYTDPDIDLRFENHEELYRARNKRSATIDSSDKPAFDASERASPASQSSLFERRFGTRRPIVPICLKRYVWDAQGKSQKIKRKIDVPQVIRLPYFIAEDKKRPGFVDFRRNTDNQAPCGSFLLVLESCVCHRGSSVDSGHYVSLIRQKPVLESGFETPDWLLFNDMLQRGKKTVPIDFDKAMESEDPYILFYRIVEIPEDSESRGSKAESRTDTESTEIASYASRKQSTIGGSEKGDSSTTIQESDTSPDQTPVPPPTFNNQAEQQPKTMFGIMKNTGRSLSRSRVTASRDKLNAFSALDDVPRSEPCFVDVGQMYYWYDVDADGIYRNTDQGESEMVRMSQDDVMSILENDEAADAGFMDRFNLFKKGTITPTTSLRHRHHHGHHRKGLRHHRSFKEESGSESTENENDTSEVTQEKPAEVGTSQSSQSTTATSPSRARSPPSANPQLNHYSLSGSERSSSAERMIDGTAARPGSGAESVDPLEDPADVIDTMTPTSDTELRSMVSPMSVSSNGGSLVASPVLSGRTVKVTAETLREIDGTLGEHLLLNKKSSAVSKKDSKEVKKEAKKSRLRTMFKKFLA